MALNPATLTASISAAFIAGGAIPGPPLVALSAALAQAIITEFTTNAVVSPAGAIPMNVAPGAPPPGLVAGTGVIL